MKKVSLVVALLLFATTVYAADVTITATPVGTMNRSEPNHYQQVAIGFTGQAEDGNIAGFALELKVDSGALLFNVADFNKGESKTHGGGYGIFPGSFRDVVTPSVADACFASDGRYSPLAPWNDANSQAGNNYMRMVVELGALWAGDANKPANGGQGTLFTVDVNMNGYTECNLIINPEATRGGVVKSDATAATTNMPVVLKITDITTYIVSGKVVGAVAPKTGGVSGIVMNGLPGNPSTDSSGNYSVVCSTSGTCTPTDPNGQWTFAPPSFSYSATMTQNVTATATECMNKLDSKYSRWVTYNKPDCWCYQKQCKGDADGAKTLGKPVASPDLTIFKAAVGQTSSYVKNGTSGGKPLICADFDRADTLGKPVGSPDLTIFKSNVGVADTSIPQCPSATINAWKN